MSMFSGSQILVTGGTGSFGKAFVEYLLNTYPDIQRIVVFSRDELKQWEMSQVFSEKKYPNIRYFIGDVRDKSRWRRAFEGIDFVSHAAALKQVPAAEYNPIEFIRTNVLGAENVVECALDMKVKNVIALSTDKAAAPINLYGATKLCSDKLFIAANNIKGWRESKFSVVRYGNVMGSRGSVIPYFLKERNTGILPITSPEMTRFNISLEEGVQMVLWALMNSLGGEIFVPKIPSYRITDVATAVSPSCKQVITGIRPGEKLHEEMITSSDSNSTIDLGQFYAILPSSQEFLDSYHKKTSHFTMVPENFSYNSYTNKHFLTIEDIRGLIVKHVDPHFVAV